MSEQQQAEQSQEEPQGEPREAAEQEEQQEPDWKALARKWEDRAKANRAEADANRDAAQRLAEIEEANKTAEQKQREALARAEAELAELRVGKLRAEVAAAKGVPAGLLTGSTQEELEASADALIAFKGESQKKRLVLPNQDKTPNRDISDDAEFARELFSRGDS